MKRHSPIRVILIGLGQMGKNHFRILSEIPGFQLVAVIDKKPIKESFELAKIQLEKSISAIGDNHYDAAIIATPTGTHFELAHQLISKKKHVLVEKPLAANSNEALELTQFAKRNRVKLAVGHIERFNPAVRKLKEVIDHGWIGKPIHFSFTRVGGYPNDVSLGNNVMMDLAVHDIDVLNLIYGKMQVQYSVCHSTMQRGVYDTAEILLRKPRGASASLHVNWITPTKIRMLRVTGTRGVAIVDYMLQTCTLLGGELLGPRPVPKLNFNQLRQSYKYNDRIEFGIANQEPLRLELEEFAKYLRGEKNISCPGSDAAYAVKIAQEVFKNGK